MTRMNVFSFLATAAFVLGISGAMLISNLRAADEAKPATPSTVASNETGRETVGAEPVQKSNRVEFRWAEDKPTEGLTENAGVDLSCSENKAYLHVKSILVNEDIANAQLRQMNNGNQFYIEVFPTKDAAKKLHADSEKNLSKPLVVLYEGKIVAAMVIMSPLSDYVPIMGSFEKAQAEKIVSGMSRK